MRFVLIFFVLALISVTGCGEEKKESTLPPTGASVFSDNCIVCHGEKGNAGVAGAFDLSKSKLTHDEAIAVITNGRKGMRSFASELSAAEIEAVVKHIETLRQ